MADPAELILEHLLVTLEGMTISAGYHIFEDPFVTRRVLNFAETAAYPFAIVIQRAEKTTTALEIGDGVESALNVHLNIHLRPLPGALPDTLMNACEAAIAHALTQDISRGALAEMTEVYNTPMPAVWGDPPYVSVMNVRVIYEHNQRAAS